MAIDPSPSQKPERSRRDVTRNATTIGLGVVLIVFAVVNLGSIKVDWIVGSSKAPLIVVIAISVLIGMALSWLGQRRSAKRRGSGSSR